MDSQPLLKKGDRVAIVAPSFSLGIISESVQQIARARFEELGLELSFGAGVHEMDAHLSSSPHSRVSDLHAAYSDPSIKAILAVIGGYNSNQLLSLLDWDLIRANPKPLIGYSDTTALQNAIYAKTGQITYSGPAYSTFGQELYFDYTLDHFKRMLMGTGSISIKPSDLWTDDLWYEDQQHRNVHKNDGWFVVNEGSASGKIIGGNLGTLSLLFGTEYMPSLSDTILFLEEDDHEGFDAFDRLLQSLVHQKDFGGVRGILLGRFQEKSGITNEHIKSLISLRQELAHLPIVANMDFGHTSPIFTFPIGGRAELSAKGSGSALTLSSERS